MIVALKVNSNVRLITDFGNNDTKCLNLTLHYFCTCLFLILHVNINASNLKENELYIQQYNYFTCNKTTVAIIMLYLVLQLLLVHHLRSVVHVASFTILFVLIIINSTITLNTTLYVNSLLCLIAFILAASSLTVDMPNAL